MTKTTKRVFVVAVVLAALAVCIDSFVQSRVRVFSALAANQWPLKSGIEYHLNRERPHFDYLVETMTNNSDYKSIYSERNWAFKETCISSSTAPECPASSDDILSGHVSESGIIRVTKFGPSLAFRLGDICIDDSLVEYGLAYLELDAEPVPICAEHFLKNEINVCFSLIEDSWSALYIWHEGNEYCSR